jgi:hypothetical protein
VTISTSAQIAANLPGQALPVFKPVLTINAAGFVSSSWAMGLPTSFPPVGATPPTGSGAVPTSATVGAMPFRNAAAGASLYLAKLLWSTPSNGNQMDNAGFLLYDRLVHTSGLSCNTTAPQTINSVSIPSSRDPEGLGGTPLIEIYNGTGATPTVATASYTNQSGVAGQAGTATITATMTAGAAVPIQLQSGDTGVRSVESLTLSAATGSVGNAGITIMRPLYLFDTAVIAASPETMDWMSTALVPIPTDACLAWIGLSPATGTLMGTMYLIED